MRNPVLVTVLARAGAGRLCQHQPGPPEVRLNYESVMDGEAFTCGPLGQSVQIDSNVGGARRLIDHSLSMAARRSTPAARIAQIWS